ncbi:uncharacterized protein BCR38DRAFT_415278 [Pseudomassariella vexata]|uniref:Uncharacterized protein n=1 Tax=Pseudomassariella vexata TaxID=1141098 RepID=A0A1Y2D5A1_9PEZI|nr:uncharacterized protein BCR38DRAFT_415278 [Pseudomassariella vexata]ORY54461.1 hypothetical protein BCR38DRAFT_415278 [Pseudomassariella vexata]
MKNCPMLVAAKPTVDYHAQEVGHVLVHHLFTETFQCLALEGSTHREQQVTELMTCIRVYTVAWDYKLSSLKDQARIYPNPSKDDMWLGDYLKDRMKALFADREVEKSIESPHAGAKSTIAELVFHNALRLHEEKLDRNNGLIDYGPVYYEDMPGPGSEVELAYNESLHEPEHKHEFVSQKDSSEPLSALDPEENESMLESEPVDGNRIADSPRYETVPKLSYDENALFLITYEEVSVESSTSEPPWQDKTEFVPGSETDTSPPVFTPPSSTTSYISIDPEKVQRLGIEATHKQEAQRPITKPSRTKAKDSNRRRLREAQASRKSEELDVVCELMS